MKISVSIVFVAIFMTVGARFIAVGARDVIRAGASTEWQYVTGLVLDSGVERRQHRSRGRRGAGRTSIIYYPKVINIVCRGHLIAEIE